MARFKNYLLVVMGFAVAGAIGAAFGTGTAQAVVATLVEVVNPNTSPVPSLNVTDPGRIAYQSTVSFNAGNCSGATACVFSFPIVPSGHRVVVQHIGAYVAVNNISASSFLVMINVQKSLVTTFVVPAPALPSTATVFFGAFDQPVLFYVDSGGQVRVEIDVNSFNTTVALPASVTLTGYELDCNVANCAPIAAQ